MGGGVHAGNNIFLFQNRIPVFTMPKNTVTLTMLAATDQHGRLHRVTPGEDMSYPERQSYVWYKRRHAVPTEV